MSTRRVTVRLLFADEGAFHHEEISIPAALVEEHERLLDLLREEPDVLKRVHLDLDRLCSAQIVDGD
ncbi:hypothetical protein BH23GEM11_BH23GEM11_20510 [soil metagenome]